MEQRLLHTPEGVRDIYSGEYARKKALLQKLHRVVEGYGYCYMDIRTYRHRHLNILMYSAERSERLRPKICINFLTARETPLYFARI